MATAISTSSLYPVVHEIDEEEYGACCCIDGAVMNRFSLQAFPPAVSNQSLQRSQSDESNSSKSSTKRRMFQAKRRRSAVQRARSEGALIDASDTLTISTEAEDKRFEEAFVLTRQIFRCESSILWECVHRESGQRYCVKIFDRRRLGSVQEQEAVEREINFLQNAQGHMGIVQLLDVIDDSEKVYVIMELMTGGNLLSKVVQQEGLCESTVKMIAKTLLLSVRHLHQLEICHNGLEPSNILLDATDGAKIGDFGHASRMGHMTGSPGTAAYMAPEVLQGVAPNAASDMWSIGVLLYFCFFGQAPFVDQSAASSRAITSSRIHKTDYSFPTTEWNHVPRYAKQLISSLIHMDPTVRLTANEALEHPWFADPVVEPVHSRRRPRRIRAVVQCLWEKMSLCRKKKDIKELASLSTNSSSPYSDRSIKHGHTREESASSMNRFYDIEG